MAKANEQQTTLEWTRDGKPISPSDSAFMDAMEKTANYRELDLINIADLLATLAEIRQRCEGIATLLVRLRNVVHDKERHSKGHEVILLRSRIAELERLQNDDDLRRNAGTAAFGTQFSSDKEVPMEGVAKNR